MSWWHLRTVGTLYTRMCVLLASGDHFVPGTIEYVFWGYLGAWGNLCIPNEIQQCRWTFRTLYNHCEALVYLGDLQYPAGVQLYNQNEVVVAGTTETSLSLGTISSPSPDLKFSAHQWTV